MANRLKKL